MIKDWYEIEGGGKANENVERSVGYRGIFAERLKFIFFYYFNYFIC